MDEAQIAQRVAQNIPRDEPSAAVEDNATQPETPSPFTANGAINDMGVLMRLQDYFDMSNIDRHNEQSQSQLREIYSWAADRAQSTELHKVLPIIRKLEEELGLTFKPNKLQQLAKFVYLKKQSDILNYQMETIGG